MWLRFEHLYLVRGWNNKHGRICNVPRVLIWVVQNLGKLRLIILFVENAREVDSLCYVKCIALLEKRPVASQN